LLQGQLGKFPWRIFHPLERQLASLQPKWFLQIRALPKPTPVHYSGIMQFNDADAAKFWPIFQQYDAELTTIGDGRTQLIVDYARNYEKLTDEADALMNKALELESQRAMLKKKYFDKMKTTLSATQAAKFFLVENEIQHIVDLQISASLPVVQTASN